MILPKCNGHRTPLAGNGNLLSPRRCLAVRKRSRDPAWGQGEAGEASSKYALPSTRRNPHPPQETRELSSIVGSHTHSLLNYGTPRPAWSSYPHRGLRDPHAQHAHSPKEHGLAWTAERNSSHLLTCTPGLADQSPFSFSYPLVPQKALTCSTLSVRQMKDSSESSAQERPPKCWGDELLTPVTPTPKPCQGSEKPPRRARLRTSHQNTHSPPR